MFRPRKGQHWVCTKFYGTPTSKWVNVANKMDFVLHFLMLLNLYEIGLRVLNTSFYTPGASKENNITFRLASLPAAVYIMRVNGTLLCVDGTISFMVNFLRIFYWKLSQTSVILRDLISRYLDLRCVEVGWKAIKYIFVICCTTRIANARNDPFHAATTSNCSDNKYSFLSYEVG